MKLETIAVTTDFSERANAAFPVAASIARQTGAAILVAHVPEYPTADRAFWPTGGPALNAIDYDRYLDALGVHLDAAAADEPSFQGLNVSTVVVRDGTIDGLESVLAGRKVDLQVLASRGRTGLKRVLLGSFAERILRLASCPALVLRGSFSNEFAPRRILAPTDFSPSNGPARRLAVELARTWGGKSRFLHVVEHDPGLYGYARDVMGSWREFQEQVRADYDRKFEQFRRDEASDIHADFELTEGNPAARIVEEAREFESDIVVIGTHGRTGWDRFLLGSVAEQVVRRAPCSVLVARGPIDQVH